MRTASETIDVFYAEDGTRFLTKLECVAHEATVAERKKRAECTKFFSVICKPDLTEGRGWYGCLFIAAEGDYARGDSQNTYALGACVTLFGSPLAFVQGSAPMDNWRVHEIDQAGFERWRETTPQVGDYTHPATCLFISNKGPVPGWPSAVPIAKLHDKKALEAGIETGPKGRR